MNMQIVEIQPRELKFIIEVKKQSSCIVHLANVTNQFVAFKVKTTSPKKYCVRPNVGIIKPKSTYDFSVTMQAQKSAQAEMQCKDKFLVQSTVVPYGTTEEEITPTMFSKDNGTYIEETKLRVILTSAPNSPVMEPVQGVLKQEASYEALLPKETHSPVLLPVNGAFKQEPSDETSIPKNKSQIGVENFPSNDMPTEVMDTKKTTRNMVEPRPMSAWENVKSVPTKDTEFYPERDEELKLAKDMEEAKLKVTKDIEDLKSKISVMDSKLIEAEGTIVKLKEEKRSIIQEKETLKQELAMLGRKGGSRKVQVGFPPLFVLMVAIISMTLGFLFRS